MSVRHPALLFSVLSGQLQGAEIPVPRTMGRLCDFLSNAAVNRKKRPK
jgi:hypothetical protein